MSNAIGSSRESNPSCRICHLSAVPLGYVADKTLSLTTGEEMQPPFFLNGPPFLLTELAELLCFFLLSPSLLFTLEKRFFVMQQCPWFSFSGVFCLNCIYVIYAAVKQII